MFSVMSMFFMSIATILISGWIYFQVHSVDDDVIITSAAKIIRLKYQVNKKKRELFRLENSHDSKVFSRQLKRVTKELSKLENKLNLIKTNKYASKNPISYSGLGLLNILSLNTTNKYYRKIYMSINEVYGSTNSVVLTKSLVAEAFSYLALGVSIVLILSVYIIENSDPQKGVLVSITGILIVFTVVYMLFDNIFYQVKKRREQLLLSFPQVISKLALLVNAGISLTEAWRTTAFSDSDLLYYEMQKVCIALDNGISLKAAYKDFIDRCNVKDISKLGVAIEQAYTKGNNEISRSLINLAEIVWEERKHRARRLGELANSKLLIPIIMIFMGIMMMVIVPILINLGV